MAILDSQKRRADLYWNSIIGAVRRNYGPEVIDGLFAAFHGSSQESLYEQLIWLGLENAVYQREAPRRPALLSLRRSYARRVLSHRGPVPPGELPLLLEEAHFRRMLGENPHLMPQERAMLNALEFAGALDGPALSQATSDFLHQYFHFIPGDNTVDKKLSWKKPPIFHRFFRRSPDGLLSAHTIYGRSFARSRNLNQFADTAGTLTQNQIRSL